MNIEEAKILTLSAIAPMQARVELGIVERVKRIGGLLYECPSLMLDLSLEGRVVFFFFNSALQKVKQLFGDVFSASEETPTILESELNEDFWNQEPKRCVIGREDAC